MAPSKYEAILCACKWCWRWHESNPDVGMGPSYLTIVNQVCDSMERSQYLPRERQELAEALEAWDRTENNRR